MLHSVWHLALLTLTEIRRRRTLLGLMLAHLVVLAVAWLLASVTMGKTVDIVMDLGLASVSILGGLAALVSAVQMLQQDVDQRTAHVLLPRMGFRSLYLSGRFIGLAMALGGVVVVMLFMLGMVAWILGWQAWDVFAQAGLAIVLEVWISIAAGLLFANASSMFLAQLLTLAVLVAGRFSFIIKAFGETIGGLARYFTDAAYYLLPNFQAINLRDRVLDGASVPVGEFGLVVLYGLTETALLFTVACLLFLRKDLHARG